jgi:hypothetical protein
MGLLARLEEFFLDLLVNSSQPFLGPRGAILGLLDLHLQLIDAALGGVQLMRKLARLLHGAIAGFVRQLGCVLEQPNNSVTGLIQHITITARRRFLGCRRRFFLGCKLPDLLGYVGARAHVSLRPDSRLYDR